ncbi:MAG: TRAP transporter substrate-binding protein [Burkholderiaceae bacterium]|nr:TRAP transporter substrate-binding protein [Burkholderiaceae bacterium]
MKIAYSIFIGTVACILTSVGYAQTVNVTNWVPVNHPLVTGVIKPLCDDFARVTEKRVKCNILPKSVSAAAQTFDAVRDGIADLAFIVDGYTAGRFLLSTVAEFPLSGQTAEVNSVAYQHIYDQYLADANEHKGVKVLAVFTHGPGQLYTGTREVKTMADFSGLKLRTGGGIVNDVIKLLGATPMLKPAPDVYELMSGGIIDGFVFNKDSPVSFNLYPLVKNALYMPGGLYNVAFTIIMNESKWDSISAADRAAIEPLLGEALARRAGHTYDKADIRADTVMRDAGINILMASPGLIAQIREKTSGLEEKWIQQVESRGVDGAKVLQAFRLETAAQVASSTNPSK